MRKSPNSLNCRSKLYFDIIDTHRLKIHDTMDSNSSIALRPLNKCCNEPPNNLQVNLSETSSQNLVLFYWNGGGCMSSRLNINPQLKSLLATTPDIFAYTESMVYAKSKQSLQRLLPGCDCFHHTAVKGSCRRGISVFFLEQYRWVMAKTRASQKHDILWIKMENSYDKLIFCFFYAPG